MDLKLAITVAVLAVSVCGDPVPPGGPKYVPVFVSSDTFNQLSEKDGQKADQAIESRQETSPQSNDYDKEVKYIFNGPPAPVYEHQPDHQDQNYSPPPIPSQPVQNYQSPQALPLQQYQPIQTPQIQQSYQVPQLSQPQSIQTPTYQISQQPSQQYQISQPAQQLYQVQQQPMQPIVVTQPAPQPVYGNQQLLASQQQQPILQQQQPMLLNQQQLMAQPIQTLQQPNQLILNQPGNQQVLSQPAQPILLNQHYQQAPILPNQQILLQHQPNPNGQTLFTGNINPIDLGQPNQVNPGYIQNQNLYTMVPINAQNVAPSQNVGTNTYLVPVQQVPNQVYAVNSG